MEVIRILNNILHKSKQKEWEALAKKYGADELKVYNKDESFGRDIGKVIARYGYELTWETEEDHIHVLGDGDGAKIDTFIIVDEPTHMKESLKKLDYAMKCLKEIEANRKKYYHNPTVAK